MKRGSKFAQEWETWKTLQGKKKLQYLWDYYKLPLAVVCILCYLLGAIVYGRITAKEVSLYVGLVNVSVGDSLAEQLSDDYLDVEQEPSLEKKIPLYTGLYLTEDENNPYHEYSYASRIKILAAIDGEQLDVVLMNREAFDAFSQNGYLCDLQELFADEAIYEEIEPYLIENTVILEDNALEVQLNPQLPYQATTEERSVGMEISARGLLARAEFDGEVYLGILQNSPRKEEAKTYVQFLFHYE